MLAWLTEVSLSYLLQEYPTEQSSRGGLCCGLGRHGEGGIKTERQEQIWGCDTWGWVLSCSVHPGY